MPRVTDQLKMTPFYGVFQYAIRGVYEALFRGEVVGTELIPLSGPFLVAANHASHLDPPVVGCQVPRQMRFFARKTLWNSPPLAWWLDHVGSIPVDRDTGDVGAIRKVLQAHTIERLGVCQYLNSCGRMSTCRLVHYVLDDDDRPTPHRPTQHHRWTYHRSSRRP